MRTWSELMASIEVIQSKIYILDGVNKNKPGLIRFTLSWNTASVEFHSEKVKSRELCRVNFSTLQRSTDQAVKTIFFYIEEGILKIQNEK